MSASWTERPSPMAGNAIRDSHAGSFATSRRGPMTAYECARAQELSACGRGVQFIAKYLGRPMEDVARYLNPPADHVAARPALVPPLNEPMGRRPKSFNTAETAILQRVFDGAKSARGAAREIGCSITAVRTWLALRERTAA